MAASVLFRNSPKVTDTIRFEFETTDEAGTPADPYLVAKVVVYFLERSYADTPQQTFPGLEAVFSNAVPVKTVGTEDDQAWVVGADEPQLLESLGDGLFAFEWRPEVAKEGDYIISWTWRLVPGGTTYGTSLQFHLLTDTSTSTASPTRRTVPGKYEHLLETYLPSSFKMQISDNDLTAEVLQKFNAGAAGVFTMLEDMVNQMPDAIDANVVPEPILPYLAKTFGLALKGDTPALWRRQIKTAIPLFKRKGTFSCLKEAIAGIGAELTSFSPLWQVVSSATWTEHFVATEGQVEFPLELTPVVDETLDTDNFEVWFKPAGGGPYTSLDLDDFKFDASVPAAYYSGGTLAEGDILKITYKVAEPASQDVENHIRSLPLADRRDEASVTYPPKNWNVKLIEEDDPYFALACSTRHPYTKRLNFGTVRTIFPYGEKMYNSEEFNGSFRPSENPCDIDKDFKDDCSCCLGSQFVAAISVGELSESRKAEVVDVLNEYVPFHATQLSVTYSSMIEDYILPPEESIEILGTINLEDFLIAGTPEFNRAIRAGVSNPTRSALATAVDAATRTDGFGFAVTQNMFSPSSHFQGNFDSALLHILSGTNAGLYTGSALANPSNSSIDILAEMPEPDDASTFPFKLSRPLWNGTADVHQEDRAYFTDVDSDILATGVGLTSPAWTLTVTSGIYAGTYDVLGTHPTRGVEVSDWPGTSAASAIPYVLNDQFGNEASSGTRGKVAVDRIARVDPGTELSYAFGVRVGDYVVSGTSYYKIFSFNDDLDNVYVSGWTAGDSAGASLRIVHLMADGTDATLGYRGRRLETTVDHYTALSVADYGMNSFLVQIDSYYYQIVSWSDTPNSDARYEIEITGQPSPDWTLVATEDVSYTIVRFDKTTPVTIGDNTIYYAARTPASETIEIQESVSAMVGTPFKAALLQPGSSDKMAESMFITDELEIIVQRRSDKSDA